MAEISFLRFANDFQDRLNALGYSLRRAEEQWLDTDRAMLSRAINGKTLSAGNYLLLCEMAGLDPYAYLERPPHRRVTLKSISDQWVTPPVPCETGDGR
ncbi:hypothetical protein FJ959_18145 [Mesorhizobium sp. B2-2-4]|uniref:hypothetical protein n=1 Tax=unclassified Mesorhizobium TaxID=325217 RepID=UPI00112CB38A|nr:MULTISPECIES: hypothetical protein [unclassified Mesorhizobium]TPM55330.1 hypothetical protein FJ959_18145 [Mesorhizobium sp. B2-2-4]TPM66297.1 hypothetical protein FJ965_14105 [Mesorhizobium sp. B2-2-1]TPN59922.1 hypothetical protein FJ984_30890 [Mesorhizobium sp. B1-1-3]